MPWLMVNQTRLAGESAVPTPLLALDVQRAGIPGAPCATVGVAAMHWSPAAVPRPGAEGFSIAAPEVDRLPQREASLTAASASVHYFTGREAADPSVWPCARNWRRRAMRADCLGKGGT